MSWTINASGKPQDVAREVIKQAAAQSEPFPSEAVRLTAVTLIKAAVAMQGANVDVVVSAGGRMVPTGGIEVSVNVHPIEPPISE